MSRLSTHAGRGAQQWKQLSVGGLRRQERLVWAVNRGSGQSVLSSSRGAHTWNHQRILFGEGGYTIAYDVNRADPRAGRSATSSRDRRHCTSYRYLGHAMRYSNTIGEVTPICSARPPRSGSGLRASKGQNGTVREYTHTHTDRLSQTDRCPGGDGPPRLDA